MRIHTLDPVWTLCDRRAAEFLRHELCYNKEEWEVLPGGRKKLNVTREYLVEGRDYGEYYFFSGFVPRALKYLNRHNQRYDYVCDVNPVDFVEPHIDGIKFRDYQKDLILTALDHGYGVIKSPTGSGKSMIIYGIMSSFPDSNILLLAHTLDITQQLFIGLDDLGFQPVMYRKGIGLGRVTVSTVQSYHKVARRYGGAIDVVIVDEGHHVANPNGGMYHTALTNCAAPIRFAVTATEADKEEQQVALEGLIGPIIGELTMGEGTELGFLAEPEIKFMRCPLPQSLFFQDFDQSRTTYAALYREAIVDNFNRNRRIAIAAEDEVKRGGIVLILVKYIDHIRQIEEIMDVPVSIVQGSVKKADRLEIKEALKSGKIQCVAATPAWVEGVDIPNLTMVINAGGGKSEREVLQKIGRGLRKTENKNVVKILDFFDMADPTRDPFMRSPKGRKHVFHNQSIERFDVCEEQGWTISIE